MLEHPDGSGASTDQLGDLLDAEPYDHPEDNDLRLQRRERRGEQVHGSGSHLEVDGPFDLLRARDRGQGRGLDQLSLAPGPPPAVISQPASRDREHPGAKCIFAPGEPRQAGCNCEPGLACQVLGRATLAPQQVPEQRGLQPVVQSSDRPLLPRLSCTENLVEVVYRNAFRRASCQEPFSRVSTTGVRTVT